MLSKLGILLVEDENGQVSVQLFGEPDKGREQFRQLKAIIGQNPFRATFLDVDWNGKSVQGESRNLPDLEEAKDRPDGWKIGSGPIYFPKDSGKAEGSGDKGGSI
jgi:hypothetical protein